MLNQQCRNCSFLSVHHHSGGRLFGGCGKGGWRTKAGDHQYRAETIAKNVNMFIASRGRKCDVYNKLTTELVAERVKQFAAHWDKSIYGTVRAVVSTNADGWE